MVRKHTKKLKKFSIRWKVTDKVGLLFYINSMRISNDPKTEEQLFHHFMRRLSARYNIIADKSQYVQLGKRCNAVIGASESTIGCHQDYNDLSIVDKQSNRIYVLKWSGDDEMDIPIVYDRHRKCLVSALPKEYLTNMTRYYDEDDI